MRMLVSKMPHRSLQENETNEKKINAFFIDSKDTEQMIDFDQIAITNTTNKITKKTGLDGFF